MSWDIYVYAEVKNNDKLSDWRPLCDRCVCDNFKYYNEGFTDELPKMNASESSHPSVKNLTSEIYNGSEFKVCYCSLKTLRNHYHSIVENFNTYIKAVYSALGVSGLCIEDEDYLYNEDEDTDSNVEVDQSNPWAKYMTFPVNKDMLSDLAVYLRKYAKALQVIGMCDTISSMHENYNDEVRLIFATL